MRARRILLADADAFFVAVARMVDPAGAGNARLLIVGGTRESRGVVCSASYEARKYGVRSAMPIARALRLCPQAMCVPVPRRACGEKSHEIRAVLEQFAPVVEGASIDEWYLDLGGTEGMYHGLYDRVRGIDHSEVVVRADAKSISRDDTFAVDLNDDDALSRELLALVTRAAMDLRGDGLTARAITVRIRDHDFKTRQASRTLDALVISDRVILAVARALFAKLRAARRVPARLLGVGLSSLTADATADQLTLFEKRDTKIDETDRDRLLSRTIDQVRAKFGDQGIFPAGLTE